MIKYEEVADEIGNQNIKRDVDGVITWIPKDLANSDYQRYLRWLNGEDEAQSL